MSSEPTRQACSPNSSLSIERCRGLLGAVGGRLSDSEIEQLRDQLRELASLVVEMYSTTHRGVTASLQMMRAEERVEVEERAAILEFEGKLPRVEAERRAFPSPLRYGRQ